MVLVNHEAEVLYAWNTCFPLNLPTKVEHTSFGSCSGFFVDNLSPFIQSPTSNFVYEILNVWLPITTSRWRLHSDGIFTSLPLNISTALLWICPCTIQYDWEGFRKYPYRGPVYCSMYQFALISPNDPATVNLSVRLTSLLLRFLNKVNSLGKYSEGVFRKG